jgi:hypothetical protein
VRRSEVTIRDDILVLLLSEADGLTAALEIEVFLVGEDGDLTTWE